MAISQIINHSFVADLMPPAPVVIDLGANRGEFSKAVKLGFGAKVFMVEPHPQLNCQLIHMDIGPVLNGAITGKRGERVLFSNPIRCATIIDSLKETTAENIMVKTFTLQDVMDWASVKTVDLLKVDIEGAELDMFESTPQNILEKFGQITVEFHDFLDVSQVPRILHVIEKMKSCGFIFVKMSWHTFGDTIFIHKSRLNFPGRTFYSLAQLWIYKYFGGGKRFLKRIFEKLFRNSL